MSEAMFPKSVVMAVGEEGFKRGWTEAVDACIAAVEATIRHDDACKSVIPGRECNCTRFDALAALREVQP